MIGSLPHEPLPGQQLTSDQIMENFHAIMSMLNGGLNQDNFIPQSGLYSNNFRQGPWTSFTPSLTATTTNPTLGTGGSFDLGGIYTRQADRLIIALYRIVFGNSGNAAGSGNYQISYPVTAVNGPAAHGFGIMVDSGTTYLVQTVSVDGTKFNMFYQGAGVSSAAIVTHSAPIAWGANDCVFDGIVFMDAIS